MSITDRVIEPSTPLAEQIYRPLSSILTPSRISTPSQMGEEREEKGNEI